MRLGGMVLSLPCIKKEKTMSQKKLSIFEGAMCCDSGVCGTEPDLVLVEFADTLKKLAQDFPAVEIMRANMTTGLSVFRKNVEILIMIKKEGMGILPLILIDGKVFSKQRYPKYDELKAALMA